MNNLHLFAGIGGGILADVILGNTICAAVEINKYCRDVLRKNQKNGFLNRFDIYEDVRQFNGDQYRGKIDTVCGGFPCQDISAAGSGAGINGEQSRLFYELVRVCRAIEPRFIFLENSPLITSRGLDTVLKKIAEIGYDAQWSTLSAGAVGAPHMRNRWWCVCKRQDVEHADVVREVNRIEERFAQCQKNSAPYKNAHISDTKSAQRIGASNNASVVETSRARFKHDSANDGTTAYTAGGGGREAYLSIDVTNGGSVDNVSARNVGAGLWKVEPDVCRVVDEFPGRVDAIRGLGNAQVPIVAALAFYLLLSRFCEV